MTADHCDILMLVLNDVAYDGRVRNEAAALAAVGWRVIVIGTQRADGKLPDREKLRGFDLRRVRYPRLGTGLWWPWRWVRHAIQAAQIVRAARGIRAQCDHAHDLPALILLAAARAGQTPRPRLVYDAHELFLFQSPRASRWANGWHRLTRPLFMRLEGALARRADGVLGLAEARARLMARWYRIPRPVVIQNALDPVGEDMSGLPDLQAAVGGRRCVVYTGEITARRRAVAELVEAVTRLADDVGLVLLGQGESAGDVRALAERLGIGRRVAILPPVAPEQVAAAIRAADAAAILMRAESWNTRAGPPNKLFEAIAAGLPVVASDMPVLRRYVRRWDLGELCNPGDPASIAAALERVLSADGQARYRAGVRAAQQAVNWQIEAGKLVAFYREMLA